MNLRERLTHIVTTGFVVANLVLTPSALLAAEALGPVQNFHNSCKTDADCRLFSVMHCCGYETQSCFSSDASPEDVSRVQADICASSKFDCQMARKSTPVSCQCVEALGGQKVCRTISN